MPQQQHYQGDDGWSKIAEYLDVISAENVLLVTGNSMYHSSGAEQALEPVLREREVTHLTCFHTNRRVEDVTPLLDQIDNKESYRAIIAVGGGSVIDAAKLLKAFWSNAAAVEKYFNGDDKLYPCELPLIAVPSTAGSGSEATRFAVVYKDKEKFSIEHDRLLPDFSVVIPSLLTSVPSHVAASSGMDALCQGIESYWSIHSTDESRQLAAQAIRLAWASIEEAVNQRTPQTLDNMAQASHLAGRAINITRTTAPHAVSYPLTSYFGITHGHAVGILTAQFLRYNAAVTKDDCLDPRGPEWVVDRLDEITAMLGADTIDEAARALTKKLKSIGLETSFSQLGIRTEQDIQTIIDHGFNPERVNNNPRRVCANVLKKLFNQ
jgi:alcohol dehydrogenase class IV